MGLRSANVAEIVGILLVLASTAMQLFYLEPLKREIEWRLAAFSIQQTGQVQTNATFDSRIAILKAVSAPESTVKDAEAERDRVLASFKTADANIADYLFEKEKVEGILEWILIALFTSGSILAAIGRVQEMRSQRNGSRQ
jgi:hypothetical protein